MGELGLGSVQWGQAYGATHDGPRPEPAVVGQILALAARAGIRVIDTAPSYGDAETRLGSLRPAHARFHWVTKTATPADGDLPLIESIASSKERLGAPSLYGLLDHFPDALGGPAGPRRMQQLEDLRSRGWVTKVGVSVYRGEQIDTVAGGSFPELVQVPLSILDQRLLRDGTLRSLSLRGVEVHARSIFLQGLLLATPDRIPRELGGLRDPVARFQKIATAQGLSPLEAALGFALSLPEVDVVLCGVQSVEELKTLLDAVQRSSAVDPKRFRDLGCDDPALLDPSAWPELC